MTRPVLREAILDANILIRILTREDTDLLQKARELLRVAEGRGVTMVLLPVTVAEIVYVLRSYYQWDKTEIAGRLLVQIESGILSVLERDVVIQALKWFRDLPQVHFADAYIAAYALTRSDGAVASFDQQLRRVPGLTVLADPADLPG